MRSIVERMEVSPPSLVQVAYDMLKKAILELRLEKGQIYNEIAVAKELGMSKTPVHEALIRLSDRGFIEILPRRGFRVKTLDLPKVKSLFEFRRPLEQTVVFKIVPTITDEQLCCLGSLVENLKRTSASLEYQENDRPIHRYMASLTENPYLIKALSEIWDLCDWIGMRILESDGRLDVWKQHHVSLYEWMKMRNADRAWAVLKEHIDFTEERYLQSHHTTEDVRA
jgi:GntR family transcriptional regulator, rspAB operon transcriptional repressor